VTANPRLLRRMSRRLSRRRVYLSALVGLFLFAPSAGGVPGDPTPPSVTPVYSPALPASGWYRGSVTLSWLVVDPESIILNMTGCQVQTFTTDTPGTPVTCTAESDGGTNSGSVKIKADRTPPTVTATAERVPDANGWYNRPVTVSYAGTDATSGIATCSPANQYGGPDLAAASAAGSCTDYAGNVASSVLSFKYDATAPTLSAVTTRPGNRRAQIAWRASSDTSAVEVLRAPGRNGQGQTIIYRGSASGVLDTGLAVGRRYEYRVTGLDEAANRAEHTITMVATGPLLSPAPAEQVTSPPRLTWTSVKKASYYNLQVIRGHKVLSVWPVSPGFQLRRTWIYNGRRYRLQPGVYRWYVWPGFGPKSANKYSKRPLGSSTFVVKK
jgi:hypothetical protein